MGDSRVLYSATYLWQGTYNMTYIARATTPAAKKQAYENVIWALLNSKAFLFNQ